MTSTRLPSGPLQQAERACIGLALLAYAAILMHIIPRHEPWADEAQAWQLAKYLPLHRLFGKYIHYEASPGLWHGFLWLLARTHVSYTGMHWITALIAFSAVSLLAIASPLPFLVRISLPFTYFLVFQYAIVARSYSLFPPLLFGLAYFWKYRWNQPLPIVVLLSLIANVSIHGLAIAFGLTLVLAIEWLRPTVESGRSRPGLPVYAGLLPLAVAFAAWCILPAKDAGWVYTAKYMASDNYSLQVIADATKAHPWIAAAPARLHLAIAEIFQVLQIFRHGLADKYQIGLILWALLLGDLIEKGLLRYALPVLSLALVSRPMPYHIYHAGLMWLLFLFLCWATWNMRDRTVTTNSLQHAAWRRNTLTIGILLCTAVQISWARNAIDYDEKYPYSPNRDGALILRKYLTSGQTVDVAVPLKEGGEGMTGEFYVVGLEPYFETEPIANMPFRFWFWGGDQHMRDLYLQNSEHRTNVVLVEEDPEDLRYHREEARLESLGYIRQDLACGRVIYPDMMSAQLCHAFYVPPKQY